MRSAQVPSVDMLALRCRRARFVDVPVLALVLCVAVAGCIDSKTQECSWGVVCPTGMYCNEDWQRCLFPGQVEACEGAEEEEPCSFPNAPEGEYGCYEGLCTLAFCGDGLIGPGEMCDDRGHEDLDGCSADCLSDETCGNGFRDDPLGEGCDDGNLVNHDGCTSGCTLEYPSWRLQASLLPPRYGCAGAYDAARALFVMFGGMNTSVQSLDDTWEFDGLYWKEVRPPACPPARMDHAFTYDSVRQRAVLHAGWTGSVALQDTWEYDGGSWTQISTATNPAERSAHALAYDSARGVVIMYGGEEADRACLGDTWEYDGTDWTRIFPQTSPSGRRYVEMVYDPVRERVVLFGGSSGQFTWTFHNDTWEYDGSDWTQVSTAVSPSPRHGHRLAWDSAQERVVLFAGVAGTAEVLNDAWVYDGGSWTQLTPPVQPHGRLQFSMGYDEAREQLVVQGGMYGNYIVLDDTWLLQSNAWSEVVLATPPARISHAMAYDANLGQIVLFGGATGGTQPSFPEGTWLYDGFNWKEAAPPSSPSPRKQHAMAFDRTRNVTVLYGGSAPNTALLDDTWEWNGSSWDRVDGSPLPSARKAHAMVTDTANGEVLLFGGIVGIIYNGDTWRYNGQRWEQVHPEPDEETPNGRGFHAMAYDERRGRVVLFGGTHTGGYLDDTWEFDGTSWEQRNPSISPGPRAVHVMVYHEGRGTIVMFGGTAGAGLLIDTWEYDGVNWAPISASGDQWILYDQSAAYHAVTRSVVTFGGSDIIGVEQSDTWIYRYLGSWPDELCENGIDDDGDTLIDCADHDCDSLRCSPTQWCINGTCQ